MLSVRPSDSGGGGASSSLQQQQRSTSSRYIQAVADDDDGQEAMEAQKVPAVPAMEDPANDTMQLMYNAL